jgi:hypothetical protein
MAISQWVTLNNGEEYVYDKTVEGVDYYIPNDEGLYVRAKCGTIEVDTGLYETDDFFAEISDYNFIMHNGKLTARFEIKD